VKSKKYAILLPILLLLAIIFSTVGLADGRTYNFNFADEDIRVVLHTLSQISGEDIVADDSVKGNITIKLNGVTFDTALQLITAGKGLAYRKVGDSYIIENADMGITKVIRLQYTRAADIKATIGPIADSLKIKIEIDDISNSLILTGSPAGCARVEGLLTSLDVLQQQVTLEAKVVAINKSNAKDLGVDWSFTAGAPQYTPPTTTTDSTTGITTVTAVGVITPISNGIIGQFGRDIVGIPYEVGFQPQINALVSNGNAKILASPKITTINGKEAEVFIGDHIPVLTETVTDGKSSTTTTYIDAGIKLRYTPSITADGTITTKIHAEVSTATLVDQIKNYRVTTRQADTNVCMKDGATMVLAGLIGSEESKTNNSVPFFGDLPIIGSLFKSQHISKTETEVVIFVTATINK